MADINNILAKYEGLEPSVPTEENSDEAAQTVAQTRHNSIGLRLLRYVFGFYLLVTVVVTVTQLVSEYARTKQDIFKQLKNLEITFKESFAVSVWNFDTDQLNSTLLGMEKIDIVSGVKITDNSDSTLASIGATVADNNTIKVLEQLDEFGIKKIALAENTAFDNLYQYLFIIKYQPGPGAKPERVGYGYIYSYEGIVFEQVKYSFFMIIINSIIKTLALWFIFLVITRRLLARPLQSLTEAVLALNPENPESLSEPKNLDKIIKGTHKDELYTLAVNFDQMRRAVIDKIVIIEDQNQVLEKRVRERTQDLESTLLELSETKDELIDAAHKAGMADSATDVLHNVGNILNSVKTSVGLIRERLNHPTMRHFIKAKDIIVKHQSDLAGFIKSKKGEKLVDYIVQLEKSFIEENSEIQSDLKRINNKVDDISAAILEQQNFLQAKGCCEKISLKHLIEETLLLHKSDFEKYCINVNTSYGRAPKMYLHKIRVLQVLENIIKNAKESLIESTGTSKDLNIELYKDKHKVFIVINDTGIGIARETLEKVFVHGFTSRDDKQGFGLHNTANYMAEMGGGISAKSDGIDCGATFTLFFTLPDK